MKPLAAIFACLLLGHPHICQGDARREVGSAVGRKVADFSLRDFRGKQHSLADFREKRLVVVAFLGTECPLAKLYGPRLMKLARQYQDRDVAFVGVNANTQDSNTEIAAYASRHGIEFPMLKDLGNKVADALGAKRTPEVFVLDKQRTVRYWGRIDDQYGVGYIRDEPKRKDLQTAIDELLGGKPVSRPVAESVGCYIGRVPKPKANAKVTYSNQIARILQKRCVECHRKGEIAPFALTKYREVAGWAETIAEVVRDRRMPPWHADSRHGRFANDRSLSKDEKRLIAQWVADGAPQGDPGDLPATQKFLGGWQLSREPDLVISMRSRPWVVAAEGEFTRAGRRGVKYKYFTVNPRFTEDKWIQAAEVLPGNRAVVHHVLVIVRPPDGAKQAGAGGGEFLAGYVPGLRALSLPKGTAKLIPAGSRLVFQVHYTPTGSEEKDLSRIGLVFADPKDVKQVVVTAQAIQRRFRIPPRATGHRVEATSGRVPVEARLMSLMPHMHLRGKSFRYEAVYPGGKRETLLDVPAYDFNWQTSYRLAAEKTLPAGTRIHCVAHYDNSEGNLANPDPDRAVGWGDQTWDEMMIGYFDIVVPRSAAADGLLRPRFTRDENEQIRQLIERYDKDGDGKLSPDEVTARLRPFIKRLDKDKDGKVSAKELTGLFRRLRR